MIDHKDIEQLIANDKEWRMHILKTLDSIDLHIQKQNGRIGKLENWRSWMLGGLGVLTFIITIMVTVAVNFVW